MGNSCELFNDDCLRILPTIATESVDAVITDPPYGINFQAGTFRGHHAQPRFRKIINDEAPFVDWLPDAYRITKPGGCLLCFCRWDVQQVFFEAIESAGFTVRSQLIWDREVHGMGDLEGVPGPKHDVIWFAWRDRFKFWGKRPTTVLRSARKGTNQLRHPTEKPVKLMCDLVRHYAPPRSTVVDPFTGSGPTGVACALLDRHFIGMELDQEYFELAKRQIAQAQRERRAEVQLFGEEYLAAA